MMSIWAWIGYITSVLISLLMCQGHNTVYINLSFNSHKIINLLSFNQVYVYSIV